MADEFENMDEGFETEADAYAEGESQIAEGENEQPQAEEDPVELLRQENEQLKRNYELEKGKSEFLNGLFSQRNQQQYQPQPQQQVEDPFAKLADDDLLTAGDYKRTLSEIKKAQEREIRTLRMEFSEQRARDKHNDYDDVIETYFADLVRQNPGLLDTVMSHKDPGESAYRLAMTHPNFQANVQKDAAKKIVQKINRNADTPKTLGARGGGQNRTPSHDPYSQMSDDDFEKHVNSIKNKG